MAGKCALDTNIISALIANEPRVVEYLTSRDDLIVPSIVIGELYYGAFCSSNVAANLARVDFILQKTAIVHCDEGTALAYGEIKHRLRQRGRPIPDNDIWIAAVAIQHNAVLATRDGHFKEVEGLRIEEP